MARHIDWSESGSIGAVKTAIDGGKRFTVTLPGWMSALVPRNIGVVQALTPIEIGALVAVGTLAVFGGLAAYAISKGYKVKRNGDVWEFDPPRA